MTVFLKVIIDQRGVISQVDCNNFHFCLSKNLFLVGGDFFSALQKAKVTLLNFSLQLSEIVHSNQAHVFFSMDERYQFLFIPQTVFEVETPFIAVCITENSLYKKGRNVFLKEIINNLPYAVFWKDKYSVFCGGNVAFARAADLDDPEKLVGKTDYDMPWKKNAEEYIKIDKEIIRIKKAIINLEEKNQDRTVLVSKVPLFDQNKEVIGILGVYTDITEKKRVERLQKEKEIAEKNAELMSILSGSVAHEVRTPLSIIQINADLMQLMEAKELFASQEQKEVFLRQSNNICQAVKECSQVIDMMLVKLKKIASASNAKDKCELLTPCSIRSTIQKALSDYPFRSGESVHYVNENDFTYLGDERMTKHILFNLIRNALHAIKEAGKGEIFIECTLRDGFNCLIFKDTATGIPSGYLPKIFNKFETSDEAHSGTGLGLAFCKLVMESIGGKIECRSELGKFTEFTLFFPPV